MNILIINDDGIDAPGIRTLIDTLKEDHAVYVAAPHKAMSAMGHAITLKGYIRVVPEDIPGVVKAYRIDGTPADCAKVSLLYLFHDIAFDVVLSGINNGGNIGTEVIYSGTFAAAHEAHRLGRNAVSLSLTNPRYLKNPDFLPAALHLAGLIDQLHKSPWEGDVEGEPYFYNINYPLGVQDPILKTAVPGDIRYHELIHREPVDGDPEAMDISFNGLPLDWSTHEDSDYKLLQRGFATIVPIHISWTNQYDQEALSRHLAPAKA